MYRCMSAVWLHRRAVGMGVCQLSGYIVGLCVSIGVCQLSGYIVGLCVSVYVSCLAT